MKVATASLLLLLLSPSAGAGETLVAARTIRSHALLGPDDVTVIADNIAGSFRHFTEVEGLEARTTLYAGRPIRPGDVGPAAVIERNQVISLIYISEGLLIATEGRALGRAGPGDRIRVMNISSRTTVTGVAAEDGSVFVSN